MLSESPSLRTVLGKVTIGCIPFKILEGPHDVQSSFRGSEEEHEPSAARAGYLAGQSPRIHRSVVDAVH